MEDKELLNHVANLFAEMMKAGANNERERELLLARLIDTKVNYLETKYSSAVILSTCMNRWRTSIKKQPVA